MTFGKAEKVSNDLVRLPQQGLALSQIAVRARLARGAFHTCKAAAVGLVEVEKVDTGPLSCWDPRRVGLFKHTCHVAEQNLGNFSQITAERGL